MKSVWRKHLILCLFLGLLAVPIYFLDLASTGGGGGKLDYTGLPGAYLLDIRHAVRHRHRLKFNCRPVFPKSGLLRIHFRSMAHQHQKLGIISQVLDERLAVWSPVGRTVTKNFL